MKKYSIHYPVIVSVFCLLGPSRILAEKPTYLPEPKSHHASIKLTENTATQSSEKKVESSSEGDKAAGEGNGNKDEQEGNKAEQECQCPSSDDLAEDDSNIEEDDLALDDDLDIGGDLSEGDTASGDEETGDDEDSGGGFLPQLIENLQMSFNIGYLKLARDPTYDLLVRDPEDQHIKEMLPGLRLNQYVGSLVFNTHADLSDKVGFTSSGVLGIRAADDALFQSIPFIHQRGDTLPYYLAFKDFDINYQRGNKDFYLGKRIFDTPGSVGGGSITNNVNSSVLGGFMPMASGRWQASMDYHINDNNKLTVALLPFPKTSMSMVQLFQTGSDLQDFKNFFNAFFRYSKKIIPTVGSDVGTVGAVGGGLTPKVKYDGTNPEYWSYFLQYIGNFGDVNVFSTLYYGLSRYTVMSQPKSSDDQLYVTYKPKVFEMTDGAKFKLGKFSVAAQAMASFSDPQDDESYVAGLLAVKYSLKTVSKWLSVKSLKLGVSVSGEHVLRYANYDFWKVYRERGEEGINFDNQYLISSYWNRSQNRSVGINLFSQVNDKLFLVGGFSRDYIARANVVKVAVRYMYSDHLHMTGFYSYIHAPSPLTKNYFMNDNSVFGIDLNYFLK